MAKTDTTKTPTSRQGGRTARGAKGKPISENVSLIEIRPGLFLNVAQLVTVRVLSREEGDVYAIAQLSNGDKLSLTLSEFCEISGKKPRTPMRKAMRPAE